MVINKKTTKKSAVKASNATLRAKRRPIKAEDEIEEEVIDDVPEEGGIEVAPEASDLLFEAEDVAELVAEITGQDVAVTADDDVVTFEVGEDQFVVEAEGDEEILESTKKPLRGKKPLQASKRIPAPRKAAPAPARKPIRK